MLREVGERHGEDRHRQPPERHRLVGCQGLRALQRRKKAALGRLFNWELRITSWRQQLVQLGQRQERQLEQRQEQQRQQLVQVRVLVQQLVLVLEELLSYRKLPERKLQR